MTAVNRTRSQIAGLLVALLVLAALPLVGATPVSADSSINPAPCFGQSVVLADFNNNGDLDRARLAGAGTRRSIEIRLALAGASSWLHFEALNDTPGALFSEDLDSDGDADLIWTDLLHQEAAVVWLGDGAGRFERISADRFAPDILAGGFSLTPPDEDNGEQASDDETNSPVVFEFNSPCALAGVPALLDCPHEARVLPVGATRRPTSRGPPDSRI